jgi:hypothetical protein
MGQERSRVNMDRNITGLFVSVVFVIMIVAAVIAILCIVWSATDDFITTSPIPGEYIVGDDNNYGQAVDGPVDVTYIGDTPEGVSIYMLQDYEASTRCYIVHYYGISCITLRYPEG